MTDQEWVDVSASLKGSKSLRWTFEGNKLEWVNSTEMTDQEIEKLREKLGSDYSVKRQNGAVTVELADIWKGVEFAECVSDVKVDRYGKEIAKGQIYRIFDWFNREVIYIDKDELGWQSKHFKPSTEAAYVEQLKDKAKELYGEIKNGDRFDCYMLDPSFVDHELAIVTRENNDFKYIKKWDRLYKSGVTIYQQGKWAKKVEEPIRVEGEWTDYSFTVNARELSAHLAKCLEDYLNKS